MPISSMNAVLQHLQADLRPDGDGMTDGELLARFLRSRDEDALAALVRRHAAMVWGVCRRLLKQHDAEDAFQATFLVLVRKVADVPRLAIANWLYGVARQTAVRLRATAAKRGRRETQVVNMPEPGVRGQETGDRSQENTDLQMVVDEELSRLPDHYRGVIVLCDLEGLTRKEAARQLGIPEGSVASRLARARAMLAKRLTRRGIALTGGSVAGVLSAESASASAPPALVESTIRAANWMAAGQAAGIVSAKVSGLTEGVVKAMFITKIKCVLVVALVVGLAVAGGARLLEQTQAQDQPKGAGAPPAVTKDQDIESGRPLAKGEPPQSDKERIIGNWFIMNEDGGRRKGEMWVITNDGILMNAKDGGANAQLYTHQLDASKNPKQIDISVISYNGPNPALGTMKGIYVLDGDELRLCLGAWGMDRPAAFPEKVKLGELTGTVLVLQRAPSGATPPKATNELPPTDIPPVPKVLSPEDAIKLNSKERVIVKFKVASVLDRSSMPTTAFGQNFILLKDGGRFSVRLDPPAMNTIMRLDIEPTKHFTGKFVWVVGVIQPDLAGTSFQIRVDDLDRSQFAVMKE